MQNARFFPNRILYREELLSTTVTYAVDLDLNEFLNLKPVVPIEQLSIRPAEFRLNAVADKILEHSEIYDLHYLASVNADIQRIQHLIEYWDYEEIGHIRIGNFRPGPDGGYAITDGNHRSIALALLLTTNTITYQPVTAITAITQTDTRHRIYEDEYSQTR